MIKWQSELKTINFSLYFRLAVIPIFQRVYSVLGFAKEGSEVVVRRCSSK